MPDEFNQSMFNNILQGINNNLDNIQSDIKEVKESCTDFNTRLSKQEEKTENIELTLNEIKELNKDCPVRLKRLKSNKLKYATIIVTLPILFMGIIYSSIELIGKIFGFIK